MNQVQQFLMFFRGGISPQNSWPGATQTFSGLYKLRIDIKSLLPLNIIDFFFTNLSDFLFFAATSLWSKHDCPVTAPGARVRVRVSVRVRVRDRDIIRVKVRVSVS